MSVDLVENKEFMQAVREASMRAVNGEALKGVVKEQEMKDFLDALRKEGVPAPLGATASFTMALFYGVVKCEPRTRPWKYDSDTWGAGIAGITSVGFMYTAYENWDDFFRLTTAFHVQGIAEAGGIFQINWFNSGGTPIGQYNGGAAGIAVFQAGGRGKWKKK